MAEPPSSPDPGIPQPVDEPSPPNQIHDAPALAAKSLHDDLIGHSLPKPEFATVKRQPIQWIEEILAETSSSNEAKVIKPELADKDTCVKSEIPDQYTSLKPEIKKDPCGQSATDKSPPGPDMHGQVKPDPNSVSLSECIRGTEPFTIHDEPVGQRHVSQPACVDPLQDHSIYDQGKVVDRNAENVKQEYSLSGTGQPHSPFIIFEPLETTQDDSGRGTNRPYLWARDLLRAGGKQ